ncbi:uncharacterized protein LOC118761705 [Octopus sinensis]|uniref:Uncharacterized protein LOC118761705 n=1 Tax=Octopus sinensis TaxID=2607531 RepID=A0A7E6ELQ2_9MOLL|nr:uncharacterized protein LOC118761705 [Octopus sinensis]
MVLGCGSSEGDMVPPNIFNQSRSHNSDGYVKLLETVVKLWLEKFAAGRSYVWLQDSAPCHPTEKSQKWLSENVYDLTSPNFWPSNSPDCYPTNKDTNLSACNICWPSARLVCNENTTPTRNGTFYWPMTKIGTNVTIPCHANVATRRCSSRQAAHSEKATIQHMTSPKCSPFTGVWQEPDMSQCYNTERITQQLKNITNEDIDKENVEEVSKALRIISEKSVYFKAEDIDLAVDIQEKMVPLISNVSANITLNNILLSINDMIDTPEEILVEAEQSKRTGKRMLDIIEAIRKRFHWKSSNSQFIFIIWYWCYQSG